MSKDRRLGRGLAALLGTPLDEVTEGIGPAPAEPLPAEPVRAETLEQAADDESQSLGLIELNVYEIDDNPFQPRRDFSESEIASLAESLKQHDMLQPVLVRKIGDRHQLISGERRLRAAIQAGWNKVPAQVREADDRLVAELAIVENLQRKDLNPIEKAMSFKRYLEEHDCTQEDLARRLKIDRSTIANLMRLLELPETVLDALRRGELSAGHARALLPLGEERMQVEFCERIGQEGLSVRAVEALVQERLREEEGPVLGIVGGTSGKKKPSRSEHVAALEQELRMALGTKIDIRQSAKGRGRLVIHFGNHEEFDRIRALLTDQRETGGRREVG
jgi:ParB family chromosome partitioning protein